MVTPRGLKKNLEPCQTQTSNENKFKQKIRYSQYTMPATKKFIADQGSKPISYFIGILKKYTHLISASHHKLSCSIIYSDNLSHGSGPWGHGQYALVFSVTCMEQLNAQKLLANQGEGMKAFHYLCSYSLTCYLFSRRAAHNEASALFVRHHIV